MIIGCDEVGRGAIAGPIVGVAYAQTKDKIIGVRDSKKLSEGRRNELYEQIIRNGEWMECWMSNQDIDEKGITWANNMVLKSAVEGLLWHLGPHYAGFSGSNTPEVYVDGKFYIRGIRAPLRQIPVVGGDDKIYEIGCASIIGKVERDNWIRRFEPLYKWFNNKGYGTKEHYLAIKRLGLSKLHRKSFIRA